MNRKLKPSKMNNFLNCDLTQGVQPTAAGCWGDKRLLRGHFPALVPDVEERAKDYLRFRLCAQRYCPSTHSSVLDHVVLCCTLLERSIAFTSVFSGQSEENRMGNDFDLSSLQLREVVHFHRTVMKMKKWLCPPF